MGIPWWSQGLGLHALIIKGLGSISGRGTKIQATGQQKKKKILFLNVIALVLINLPLASGQTKDKGKMSFPKS